MLHSEQYVFSEFDLKENRFVEHIKPIIGFVNEKIMWNRYYLCRRYANIPGEMRNKRFYVWK